MALRDPPLSHALGAMFGTSEGTASIDKALQAVRRHMAMDVAFITQFGADDRVMRHVDTAAPSDFHPGLRLSNDQGYCRHVVEGRLPELIPDTGALPFAASIAATAQVPVGAHLSVPIWLSDGSLYGTLCCLSYQPDPSLGQRDLQFMRVFADLMADRLESEIRRNRDHDEKRSRIERIIGHDGLSVVYQPIYRLDTGAVSAVECLSRFRGSHAATPDRWFADAAEVGLGPQLEGWAIRQAVRQAAVLPADVDLAVNGSPLFYMSDEFPRALDGADISRLVLEVTEHADVQDYRKLQDALGPWRRKGLRIAIDDAGAGYASMRHILDLQPDYIKLDISLVRGINLDARRRALAAALIAFAREIGSQITAEGVETEAELQTLRQLGADRVQGFHMSRPLPPQEAADVVIASRQRAMLGEAVGSSLPH